MNILTTNGFTKGSYGGWMNKIMETSPSKWVMFHDHDIFLFNGWYDKLLEAIKEQPEAGLFTCVTNRIGNTQQRIKNAPQGNDLIKHAKFAKTIEGSLLEATRPISGLIMLTNRDAWKKSGKFRTNGIIGVDNNYHGKISRAGYKTYIIRNLYVYHWYRQKV